MRRARATSARAAPPSQRGPAQRRASPLHAQATSRSEGLGWHVAARPCKEEGRLLARAVLFYSARSDRRQRGAVRACSRRACCASSLERASAVASKRTTRASHPTKCGPELARERTALTRKKGRLLARAVPFHGAWNDFRQRDAARARNKRACCASSPERTSAVARKRTTRASHLLK